MKTDFEVRRLLELSNKEKNKINTAHKAGMDVKTARKYLRSKKLPSEMKKPHDWRTREDPFKDILDEVNIFLESAKGIEGKFLFEYFQNKYPGKFSDGQLRTFQRRLKTWKATEGPEKEIFFSQVHHPGELAASDFTDLTKLGITIDGELFEHKFYHFVLTYSNWETGMICFSESWESFSQGLQNALWQLGCVPEKHKTDCLSAAVNNLNEKKDFTEKYKSLLGHYKLAGVKTNPASPHENGDVEQRHFRFVNSLQQRLILRGSNNFNSREEYSVFISKMLDELNVNREQKFQEELSNMKLLPFRRLESCTIKKVRVSKFSTINVRSNVYSVFSQLQKEWVNVKIYPETLEVWYGSKNLLTLPRLYGKKKHKINYRHVISSLRRKPGAFANYVYRDDLFPSMRFRIAYDELIKNNPGKADKEYLNILYLAATESEEQVDNILNNLIGSAEEISYEKVNQIFHDKQKINIHYQAHVEEPDLMEFDYLLEGEVVLS